MNLSTFRFVVAPLMVLIAMTVVEPSPVLAAAPTSSGDASHPFVMQETGNSVAKAPANNLTPFKPAPKLLPANAGGAAVNTASATAGPVQEVFGFALASSLNDPTLGYPSWNFNQLSTVAFFGLHVNTDGTFAHDSGMSVWNSSQLTGLLSTAHSHGARVALTIIDRDCNAGTPTMRAR